MGIYNREQGNFGHNEILTAPSAISVMLSFRIRQGIATARKRGRPLSLLGSQFLLETLPLRVSYSLVSQLFCREIP